MRRMYAARRLGMTSAILLQVAINLAEQYEAAYEHTRRQLMTQPKGKQFDFDKDKIFDKFFLFKRRLEKLVDMFTTIHQFSSLEQHTHIDGLSAMITNFHSIKDDVQVRIDSVNDTIVSVDVFAKNVPQDHKLVLIACFLQSKEGCSWGCAP